MMPEDWRAVRSILAEGIATGNATFESEPPSWEDWDRDHLDRCRIVAVRNGIVIGWAALAPTSKRAVYAGVAEHSVYVAAEARGQGLGRRLLHALIAESEAAGIWTLQASVFPENRATLRLHVAAGFREVGRRQRIGRHHDRWRDTVLLERRSERVGRD